MEQKPEAGIPQPGVWREEFSVHAPEDAYVLRRQFTKFLVLTSAAMAVGNGWIWVRSLFARPPAGAAERIVASASELQAGTVKLFSYPGPDDPCILVRRTNGQLAAFSQKCTHLSCAVYYAADRDRLECPCHEGYFSPDDGRVLQGPPPRPLPRITLQVRGDEVIATGVETGERP
jgi:Rieske Fe-S protein